MLRDKSSVIMRGQALSYLVRSTIPAPHENVAMHSTWISSFKLHQMHHNLCSLFPSYYCTKYIDNYSNTTSGIPACLGLFVSCLSDRLVDIVSDLPLLSLGIIVANPSLSGIWLSGIFFSVAF